MSNKNQNSPLEMAKEHLSKLTNFDDQLDYLETLDDEIKGQLLFCDSYGNENTFNTGEGTILNIYKPSKKGVSNDIRVDLDKVITLNQKRYDYHYKRNTDGKKRIERFKQKYKTLGSATKRNEYLNDELKAIDVYKIEHSIFYPYFQKAKRSDVAVFRYFDRLYKYAEFDLIVLCEDAIEYNDFLLSFDGVVKDETPKKNKTKPPNKDKNWIDFFRNDSNNLEKFRKLIQTLEPDSKKEICILIKALKDYDIDGIKIVKDYGKIHLEYIIPFEFELEPTRQYIGKCLNNNTLLKDDTYKHYLSKIKGIYQPKVKK